MKKDSALQNLREITDSRNETLKETFSRGVQNLKWTLNESLENAESMLKHVTLESEESIQTKINAHYEASISLFETQREALDSLCQRAEEALNLQVKAHKKVLEDSETQYVETINRMTNRMIGLSIKSTMISSIIICFLILALLYSPMKGLALEFLGQFHPTTIVVKGKAYTPISDEGREIFTIEETTEFMKKNPETKIIFLR